MVLAGHTLEYFHNQHSVVSCLQEADDSCEKSSEEKKAKECILDISHSRAALAHHTVFDSYSCVPGLSPVLDLLKPPPDVTM